MAQNKTPLSDPLDQERLSQRAPTSWKDKTLLVSYAAKLRSLTTKEVQSSLIRTVILFKLTLRTRNTPQLKHPNQVKKTDSWGCSWPNLVTNPRKMLTLAEALRLFMGLVPELLQFTINAKTMPQPMLNLKMLSAKSRTKNLLKFILPVPQSSTSKT